MLSSYAIAADGTWTGTTGGNWSAPAKWSAAIVADGVGSTADFSSLNLTADTTVHLDSDRTLTNLVFGDTNTATAAAWILDHNGTATNNLILAGTSPTITVNALGTGKSATISAVIEGSAGLTKTGAGTLALSAANTYTGATTVTGALELQHIGATSGSTSLTLNNGSTLQLRSDISATFSTPAITLNPSATTTLDVGQFASGTGNTLALGGAINFTFAGNSTSTINVTGTSSFSLGVPTVNISNTGASGFTQTKVAFKPSTANVTLGNVNGITVGSGRDVYLVLDGSSSGNQVTGKIANPAGGTAWTFLTKQGTGKWTVSTNSTSNFAGNTFVTAGILNVQVINALGNTNRGTTVSSGAALELQSASSLDYSTAEALTLNGNGIFNTGALRNVSGDNTFAGLLTLAGNTRIHSDAGSFTLSHTGTITGAAFDLTIGGAGNTRINGIVGTTTGNLIKEGSGTLTLGGANTYSGATLVNAGTLTLATAGSLANTSSVNLASGATFDVSAIGNYIWPAATALIASGGELRGGSSIDLGNAALALNFTPANFTGDSTHPALMIPSGTLSLNGAISISNDAASPLSEGTYTLISQASGTISGTPVFNGNVAGQGIQSGKFCYLQITGGNLELVVRGPYTTTTTLTRHAGTTTTSTYGDTLQYFIKVNPATASGSVVLFDGGTGGTLIGTAELTGGSAIITPSDTALTPGSHANLVARYSGNTSHLPSTSPALSPLQSVSVKPLTLSGAAALDKYYDGTTAGSITGTLTGVESGDVVSFQPSGTFAGPNPGSDIAVTSTATLSGASAAKYRLIQATGLSAEIIAANLWTGGAGGTGTNTATGTNYSPAATTTNPYNAIFNGLDPATTDLSLASAIGGAVGTSGMVFGFAGNQTNPVTLTGSTGASARIASIIVAPGTGAVTYQGTLPFILGGPAADTSHSFVNDSANPLVFQNTGNWIPGGSGTHLRSMLFSGTGDIAVASSIVPSTPSRMSLAKSGTGTLTLSGTNTYSGGTTLSAGKIIATTPTALGTGGVLNHGTLDLTAGAVNHSGISSFLSGNGAVNVTLGTGTATTPLNGDYSAFTGTWNLGIGAAVGAGKVQMNGLDHASATIHVLENATLYTTAGTHNATLYLHGGNTGESFGQLRIEGSATWAGDVILAEAITGTGDGHLGASSGTGTISGNIGETGGPQGLVKDGDGTTILTGSNTYTGPTSINDGTLLVNVPGSLAAASAVTVNSGGTLGGSGTINGPVYVVTGGILSPAISTPETLTVNHAVTLAGTALFRADRTLYPHCGRVSASSSITYGGTLKVVNTGPALKLGDELQLFTASAFSGGFSSILLPPLGYNLTWDISRLAVDGSISVASAANLDHPVITLTPGTFYQQILGIGGNFCQGEQNALVGYERYNEMFSPAGLNMSFVRISTARELAEPGFATFDASNVATVREFRARQPYGRVMLTAWTPPESLKSTNSPYQGTLAKSAGGQYRYADYAAWWTRALQFYQTNSVLPDYVSIQNEADFTPTPPSSGSIPAYMAGNYLNSVETSSKAGYPQALAAVRSAFAAAGLGSMKMIGPDTTAIGGDKVKNYLDNIPAGQIDAIAHHLYQDSPGSTGTTNLSRLQTQYPNWEIPKFMTELNPHDPYESWDPDQPAWMKLAVTMHNVFTYERANTYMVWSSMYGFIDRFTGKPNNDHYYALAHFSRFVNANNWRVAASSNDPDIAVTHYRHYGGPGISDRQIIVMINKSTDTKHTTVGTSASWSATPAQRFWQVHQTANDGSVSKRLAMTEIDQGPWLSGDRQLVLPPHSLTTALVNTGTIASLYSHQQVWRFQHFGIMDNAGNAADSVDADNDGETNLYEFATGRNPLDSTLVSPAMIQSGANLEFTYTRSKAAIMDGFSFTVEWSDTLEAGSWSTTGIANQNPAPVAQDTNTETLMVLVPAGSGRRFVRLKTSKS